VPPPPLSDISALYRAHAADVFRFAFHLCGERSDAEDITAETFARLLTSSSAVGAATVKGYLFAIARNVYLQRRRAESRHVPLDDTLHDPRHGPDARAGARDEIAAVVARLAALPPLDRAAFRMRVAGLSYEEIAEALDVSVVAARVKVHRARRMLAGIR
jgi:RNA polymerase sigma factor (sigma-70 family)